MRLNWRVLAILLALAMVISGRPGVLAQQGGRGANPFPGGTREDGSLLPSRPVTQLFTQDSYTEYEILEPGSESFRIKFLTETSRPGATEIVNATRGGSEGSGIEVYDPRTGLPMPFTYEATADGGHLIRAKLPQPVPEGGIGRAAIYKTYKDARTYLMNGEDIVWVRSLSGYRLGVVLPKGFGFISANVAAQLSTTASGQLRLAFANPSGQSNPVTIHARRTAAAFVAAPYTDMFLDDMKTLYDLEDPATSRFRVEQTYSDPRKGASVTIDALQYMRLENLQVTDLDTARPLQPKPSGAGTVVPLVVPITNAHQSAHLRVTGSVRDETYRVVDGGLVFTRELRGLRNTVLLPAGWDVSGASQSGTIGLYQGRAFVSFINLNAENRYRVTVRARRAPAPH